MILFTTCLDIQSRIGWNTGNSLSHFATEEGQGGPFQEMGRQNLESADILLIGYSGLQQLKIQVCILIAARWCMNLRSCSAILAPPCLRG